MPPELVVRTLAIVAVCAMLYLDTSSSRRLIRSLVPILSLANAMPLPVRFLFKPVTVEELGLEFLSLCYKRDLVEFLDLSVEGYHVLVIRMVEVSMIRIWIKKELLDFEEDFRAGNFANILENLHYLV